MTIACRVGSTAGRPSNAVAGGADTHGADHHRLERPRGGVDVGGVDQDARTGHGPLSVLAHEAGDRRRAAAASTRCCSRRT